MHGGKRPKWTSFYTCPAFMNDLAAECDQQHEHAPWGVSQTSTGYTFNTAEEAEYPPLLCSRIADLVLKARQPRGSKHPELLSEFQHVDDYPWPFECPHKMPSYLSQAHMDHFLFRSPAKILSCTKVGNERDESEQFVARIGVYRSPMDFVAAAQELSHPFDGSHSLDDGVKMNMFQLLTRGVEAVQAQRQAMFDYYHRRAVELQTQEEAIHAAMSPPRERLVDQKKFLLFAEMSRDAGVQDDGLVELQSLGTSLYGRSGSSNLFQEDETDPAMTELQLMRSSRWSRKMLKSRSPVTSDEKVLQDVWEVTLKEAEAGWLEGPLSESQVADKLGPLFVASPRFGLVQSDKVRPIDDMSVSMVNSAFAAQYKLDLEGVDGISVMARTFVEAVQEDRSVSIELSDGSKLVGVLHDSFSIDDARRVCGRTLDLEAAYKQMLVRESSLWASVLLVPSPGGEKHYFISRVLPFGASAAVYAFNRIARAIYAVGVKLFGLIWTNYYDDYPQLDLSACGDSAQVTAEHLLDLLGWRYSKKMSKRLPFGGEFSALGVVFDFSQTQELAVIVGNKPDRVAHIVQEITGILECGSFPPPVATSLRGRLQFAEGQTFGRAVALHMRSCHLRGHE